MFHTNLLGDTKVKPADPADPAGQSLGQRSCCRVPVCLGFAANFVWVLYLSQNSSILHTLRIHPHTPTSKNYMQRNTHRYTHIHTKQDQPAQHSNKTKRLSFSPEEVEHKTKAVSVNQSASFWCTNQKLVVWKANCLTQRCWFASGPFSRCTCTLYRFTIFTNIEPSNSNYQIATLLN